MEKFGIWFEFKTIQQQITAFDYVETSQMLYKWQYNTFIWFTSTMVNYINTMLNRDYINLKKSILLMRTK